MTIENTTAELLAHILELEKRVWTALVDGDAAADRALLSTDFLGVYSTGFANREDHVGQFAEAPTMVAFRLSEERLRVLTPEIVLLSYKADYLRPDTTDWQTMLISSLWEQRQGFWVNSFSQDTPVSEHDAVPH